MNNTLIDPRELAGFKVAVSSKVSPVPVGEEMPVIEDYPEITDEDHPSSVCTG